MNPGQKRKCGDDLRKQSKKHINKRNIVEWTKRGDQDEKWYCYTISTEDCKRSYVGKTNNLVRRKRQHCGEIKGGAKYTRGKNWFYAFYIGGFSTERSCLQFEWRCHYEGRKNRRKRTG